MQNLFALPYIIQSLLAALLTWSLTALGAALVLFTRKTPKTAMDGMLAFGAGVMLASAFWSLLRPAAEQAEALAQPAWLILCGGFLAGSFLPECGERLLVRAQLPTDGRRCRLLVTAITLHNIPEGLAVGMAFGACAAGAGTAAGAWMLAVGVALQNFPEGAAVSLPLRRDGFPIRRAFMFGQLSGAVEPLAGLAGFLLAAQVASLLPFALSFAAGAMITVASTDLIPESQRSPHGSLMTFFTVFGFVTMTALDLALG